MIFVLWELVGHFILELVGHFILSCAHRLELDCLEATAVFGDNVSTAL